MAKHFLTKKSDNMSKWYTEVIQQAKLADYSPVKGCMVIRPNGYGIWENIQKNLDPMLKALGVKNSYFPIFIPMSLLQREADHVEGFSPELAVVTHGGGEELQEKLVVRPTSETIMYEMYSQWIQSHRDLPMSLNQWNNAVRWEMRTYFFLRTTEFLWQEAHTAHANHDDSWKMVLGGLEAYRTLVEDYLAIPVIKGRKSRKETFAGADVTTTIEALMPDGKALQAGTSHDLGQNFSKVFNIDFQDTQGETQYVWQTSYGLSTRTIGGLIMTHGDDDGLIIPPRVATYQVCIVTAGKEEVVQTATQKLQSELESLGIRVTTDSDTGKSLGWKLNEAEIQGIPLVLILGEREVSANEVTVLHRHTKEKNTLTTSKFMSSVKERLETIQIELFERARQNRDSLLTEVDSYDQFKEVMATKRGFIKAFWCENDTCEQQIKDETKATTRCLPFTDTNGSVAEEDGQCIKCGNSATHRWLFAQAY